VPVAASPQPLGRRNRFAHHPPLQSKHWEGQMNVPQAGNKQVKQQ
jgi:hypothetical protein